MAATKKGVWNLQDVRDKQLASEWSYVGGGRLWVWGNNTRGMLALNQGPVNARSSPTQLGTSASWMTFGIGPLYGMNTGAIKSDGTLWSWGYNYDGKLGLNQAYPGLNNISSPNQVGSGTDWKQAACDYDSAVAVKTDGTLWIWGNNAYGELGLNDRVARSSPTQVPGTTWVRATGNTETVLATKSDNTLWGWGLNDHGCIGAGFNTARSSPVQIPGDWDSNSCRSGRATSGALRPDGTCYTWGSDTYGSGGRNSETPSNSPIQLPGTWQEVHMGYRSGGGIKSDGTLWMWGRNAGDGEGVLGQNSTAQNISSPIQVPGTWEKMGMYNQRVMALK